MSHRIARFDRDGKYLSSFGKRGTGPGEFMQPHGLALDSQGRLFVADRGNNRVQVMSTDGKFIADWPQFSRPSGVFIDKNDMLYSADSESGSVNPPHKAWMRGIRDRQRQGRQGDVLHSRSAEGSDERARWPPKAWRWTRPATSTARKSGRGRCQST